MTRMCRWIRWWVACAMALNLVSCGRVPDSAVPPPAPAAKPAHSAYALEWLSNDVPNTISRGAPTTVRVAVRNTGDWPWPDPFTANPSLPNGTYAVRLSYRWMKEGRALPQDSQRAELTRPVPPGETANFTIQVTPPSEPGHYDLQLDLVEELVAFFATKGADKLVIPVTVQ